MAPSFSLARSAPWITERLARPLTARRHSQGEIGTERTALHGAVLFSFHGANSNCQGAIGGALAAIADLTRLIEYLCLLLCSGPFLALILAACTVVGCGKR
jgi:hypothetical protein